MIAEEWEEFRVIVKECTKAVCGMRRVVSREEMGAIGASENVGMAVIEEKRAFEEWQLRRDVLRFRCHLHSGHRELW